MSHIRDAAPADVRGIAAIFNHAIVHTTATWNDQQRTVEEMTDWVRQRRHAGFPVLVAAKPDDADAIEGFASFGPFRPHEGYAATVEHSLYVAPTARRRGHGLALLEALEARARDLSKHAMVGALDAENRASIALHARRGFVETAHMPEVGRKFGRWLTLVFMLKILA